MTTEKMSVEQALERVQGLAAFADSYARLTEADRQALATLRAEVERMRAALEVLQKIRAIILRPPLDAPAKTSEDYEQDGRSLKATLQAIDTALDRAREVPRE